MTKKQHNEKTLRLALFFTIIVGVCIVISLGIKAGLVFARSHFDGQHQFIMQIDQSSQKSDVLIFNPDSRGIAILALSGKDAGMSAQQTIQLPIDATLHAQIPETDDQGFVHSILTSWEKNDLNFFDKIKLLLFTQTVTNDNITTIQIHLPADNLNFDSTLTNVATDKILYKEGVTIAIVNGSNVAGLGNKIAKLLTHIGANVISVTTADKTQNNSTLIYTGAQSYTLSRLTHIFHLSPILEKRINIAQITLTIGTDQAKEFETL